MNDGNGDGGAIQAARAAAVAIDSHAQHVADNEELGNPRMNRRARRAYLATRRHGGGEEVAQEAARRTLASR